MLGKITLLCLIAEALGCATPKMEMSQMEVSSLCDKGKIVVDDSQDEQGRINAVEEYCKTVNGLLARGNVKVRKRIVLQSLKMEADDENSDFLFSFRLDRGSGWANCCYISLKFDGEALVWIEHGTGIE